MAFGERKASVIAKGSLCLGLLLAFFSVSWAQDVADSTEHVVTAKEWNFNIETQMLTAYNGDLRTKRGKVDKSYLSKEEAMLYNELEIKNDICKFGWRVRQANMNYELSNNDDFDNGLIKSESNHYNKNTEENSINNDKTIESIKDYEKIQIDDNILKFIENKIGYDQKYMIKNLKKNAINYATATYYLKYKELSNENVTVEEDEFF